MLLNNAYWWFTEQKQHQNLKKYLTKPVHVWDYSHNTPWQWRFLSFLYQILFWYKDLMQTSTREILIRPFRKSNTFSVTFFSSLALLVLAVFYYYHYTWKLLTQTAEVYIRTQGVNHMNIFTNLTGGSFSQLIQWTLQSLNILNQLGNLEIWRKKRIL